MKNHNEIFYLSNIFENKVNGPLNNLNSKSYEIKILYLNIIFILAIMVMEYMNVDIFGNSLKNKYND